MIHTFSQKLIIGGLGVVGLTLANYFFKTGDMLLLDNNIDNYKNTEKYKKYKRAEAYILYGCTFSITLTSVAVVITLFKNTH